MSRSRVKISAMAEEIASLMEEYAGDVAEDMKREVREVATDAAKELKRTSPEGRGTWKGHYKDGWKSDTTKETSVSISMAVHNDPKYRLAHLLEKGHAKRGGGRVAAIPHIAPAEKNAEKELMERLEARLG